MKDIPGLLEQAKQAAIKAGEAILSVYDSGDFDVTRKGDQSPLTRADKAAHTIIAAALEATGLPILSEEGSQVPYEERKAWDWFWLVDPLDGTKEFIKRNGEFTVNIALVHGYIPVAGVIYSPCLAVLYYGSAETGVYKKERDNEVQLLPRLRRNDLSALEQKEHITIVASKSHMNEETEAFISRFRNKELTSMGSSFKLMLLAEGVAEIYPRLAPTMEWDTAAGHALLRSLNKGVYQTDLKSELVYNKAELLNPSFIAF
ncbi:MAG TPA: 3'(2'),5'-bisphosphate nucleotidase CysQ [Flavisolibacter sp.]|jgi:3'(2'), 5'-bisphosphate nucleotidase|nr:3'(2'),5'-bisphosphate nucleotidase CysQ [Flavisolibacter sp.]